MSRYEGDGERRGRGTMMGCSDKRNTGKEDKLDGPSREDASTKSSQAIFTL
jgi:hypothetical protein